MWSAAPWTKGHVPTSTEQAYIYSSNITLDSDIVIISFQLISSSSLNAGSYTLTMSNNAPISVTSGCTFNAGTSTVKFSDANHLVNTSFTLYNWQWAAPLTAPRTLTIQAGFTVTKAAGGTFNLDGSSATNTVSFAGTGSIAGGPITVYYCGGNPGPVAGIICIAGGPPAPSASTPTPAPSRLQVWGWNFGGSLADLVNQAGLAWWPGLAPLNNVGVEINVGDPFTLGYVSNQTMMALPPVTTAQPVITGGNQP